MEHLMVGDMEQALLQKHKSTAKVLFGSFFDVGSTVEISKKNSSGETISVNAYIVDGCNDSGVSGPSLLLTLRTVGPATVSQ